MFNVKILFLLPFSIADCLPEGIFSHFIRHFQAQPHFDADLTTSKCRRAGSGAVQFQAPAVEVWMTAFKACSCGESLKHWLV